MRIETRENPPHFGAIGQVRSLTFGRVNGQLDRDFPARAVRGISEHRLAQRVNSGQVPVVERFVMTVATETVTEAFREGLLAWWNERQLIDNPYPIPGRRAAEWAKGWEEAERDFRSHPMTSADLDIEELAR